MLKKLAYGISALAVIGTVMAVSANKQPAPLNSEMRAYVVGYDSRGNEVLTNSREAEPGQVIQYQLTYTNNGNKPFQSLAVTGPIPPNTQYVADSSSTHARASLSVSIDGGRTFEREPVKRQKRLANGQVVSEIISPSKYTHVRWNVADKLHAGTQQMFNYRVHVK